MLKMQEMKLGTLLITALLCFQTTQSILPLKDKYKECTAEWCKLKNNRRLRILRDLSQTLYPRTNIIDLTLTKLHNTKKGAFREREKERSNGYEIPNIACPDSKENTELLPCPTPDRRQRIHCIDYFSLCDRHIHCPNGEDEDPLMCLFHKSEQKYTEKLTNAIYTLSETIKEMDEDRKPDY